MRFRVRTMHANKVINIPIHIIESYDTTILSIRNDIDPTKYLKFCSVTILPKGYVNRHRISWYFDTMILLYHIIIAINEFLNDSVMTKC